MPYAIFDYMGAFLRSGFAHVDKVTPVIKIIIWLLLSRLQGHRSPEPSEPCLRNLPQHAPELSRTVRNLLRPSGTNLSEPSGVHRNPPKFSGTFRNLPPEPTPFYAGTLRKLPEPTSGTYTSARPNSPEPSGTFWNLPPEPAPATRTSTHRSLSGLKTPLAYAVGEKEYKYIYYFSKLSTNENIIYQI